MARAAVAKSRSVGDNETGQSDARPFHMSSQQRNGPSVNGENDNLSLSGLVYAPFITVDLWLTNTSVMVITLKSLNLPKIDCMRLGP